MYKEIPTLLIRREFTNPRMFWSPRIASSLTGNSASSAGWRTECRVTRCTKHEARQRGEGTEEGRKDDGRKEQVVEESRKLGTDYYYCLASRARKRGRGRRVSSSSSSSNNNNNKNKKDLTRRISSAPAVGPVLSCAVLAGAVRC